MTCMQCIAAMLLLPKFEMQTQRRTARNVKEVQAERLQVCDAAAAGLLLLLLLLLKLLQLLLVKMEMLICRRSSAGQLCLDHAQLVASERLNKANKQRERRTSSCLASTSAAAVAAASSARAFAAAVSASAL